MARWTDSQIREGMLHDDLYARSHAFETLAESRSAETETAKQFFRGVEKFGRDMAFQYYDVVRYLSLDGESLERLVRELSSKFHKADDSAYFKCLSRWLSEADPALLLSHREAIQSAPRMDPKYRREVNERLKLAELDSETLWKQIRATAQRQADEEYLEAEDKAAKACLEVLAYRGFPAADVVLPLIPLTDMGDGPADFTYWMGLYAVELAGRLRLHGAAPAIAKLLSTANDDSMIDESQYALIRLGGNQVVAALEAAIDDSNDLFDCSAFAVLQSIRTDESLACILTYPDPQEGDAGAEDFRILALGRQFSHEANERLLEWARMEDFTARDALLPLAVLMGEGFPERDKWLAEKAVERAEQERRFSDFSRVMEMPIRRPPPVEEPLPAPIQKSAAGRNDPCPCGSGKKYKKCCLNK